MTDTRNKQIVDALKTEGLPVPVAVKMDPVGVDYSTGIVTANDVSVFECLCRTRRRVLVRERAANINSKIQELYDKEFGDEGLAVGAS